MNVYSYQDILNDAYSRLVSAILSLHDSCYDDYVDLGLIVRNGCASDDDKYEFQVLSKLIRFYEVMLDAIKSDVDHHD